jgi:aminopeptidase N
MRILFKLFFFCLCFGSVAQQTDVVDFISISARVEPIPSEEKVKGTVRVNFRVLKNTDSVYLDAHSMTITNVALESIKVNATHDKIWFTDSFESETTYTAFFSYETKPKQTLYFTEDQIWTQGQGKYTSHWLPSLDDMNDKIEFDLSLIAPSGETVIANGKLLRTAAHNGKNLWEYDMRSPMSSYLVAFAMGDFDKLEITSDSGIPIELYFKKGDAEKAEPTYRHTKRIFDFLENEIGIPYPWQNYKQVPVRDFLYAGMENTTVTIFSEAFVVDSIGFTDRNYVNVNAHELAHQWFGNLITEKEGTHHWLQEGFATYYALLAEREIFGEDYFYWKLYNSAEQLKQLSDEGRGEALLNPKASSLTFYEKGAWALHILNELIGEEAFKEAVKNYLATHAFRNVTTEDFLKEVRNVTTTDFSQWKTNWLEQSAFQGQQAYESLTESLFMRRFFEISALRSLALKDKAGTFATALTNANDFIGQEIVYQLLDEPLSEAIPIYKKAFATQNVTIRQAIALSLQTVPEEMQNEFESLLQDDSYLTKEAALYVLWLNFPEERKKYLDEMKDVEGFHDKNLKQLWLALASITEGYMPPVQPVFIKELQNYTSPEFSFEIREKAFGYVSELKKIDEKVLTNLIDASTHHYWRFRNYARELLDNQLEKPEIRKWTEENLESFSEAEQRYLRTKINNE